MKKTWRAGPFLYAEFALKGSVGLFLMLMFAGGING